MNARATARGLAGAAVIASAMGVVRAALQLSDAKGPAPAVLIVLSIGLPFAILGLVAIGTQRVAALWMSTGAMWASVILHVWTIWPFFILAAMLLLVSALVYTLPTTRGKALSSIPVWFLFGASGFYAFVFAINRVSHAVGGIRIVEAPLIVQGALLFLLASGVLAPFVFRSLRRHRYTRRR